MTKKQIGEASRVMLQMVKDGEFLTREKFPMIGELKKRLGFNISIKERNEIMPDVMVAYCVEDNEELEELNVSGEEATEKAIDFVAWVKAWQREWNQGTNLKSKHHPDVHYVGSSPVCAYCDATEKSAETLYNEV